MAVYFMQPIDGGPVKIGHSENVEDRRRQLERYYGRQLAILAVRDGGKAEEGAIHERFAHLRLPGPGRRGQYPEQFQPALDLMTFIGRPLLVGANPDAVEAMNPAGYDPSRNDRKIRLDARIVGKAKMVAKHKGITLSECLTELLRGPLDKAYLQMLRELEKKA